MQATKMFKSCHALRTTSKKMENTDQIKDKGCIVLTVVSKENNRHLHSTQTSMSHSADHWLSRNLATSLHTWITFSCTNGLQDYCKIWHAGKLLGKLGYLMHILWPSELMQKLQIHQESVFLYARSLKNCINGGISYLCHNFYRLLLLPPSKCRLKFDLILMSHILANPLSTRPTLVEMS